MTKSCALATSLSKTKIEFRDMLFDVLVVGGDGEASQSRMRVYFALQGPDRKICVETRLLDLRLLHRVNNGSLFEQIRSAFAAADLSIQVIGCWVADGTAVNGVQLSQADKGDNVWAMIWQ
jgi:hypothetical protein